MAVHRAAVIDREDMPPTSFVSTTIPYVNGRPHLGHAFEYVQTDCFARHMRLMGDETFVLSGSDDNSLKNVLAAEREGVTPRELVDRNVVHFRRLIEALDVRLDRFIETSRDVDHREGATEVWRRMAATGDIYEKSYAGLYCVGCEQFYGPSELVDGKCPEHLVEPELVSERNYFFRLSGYGERLEQALRSGELVVTPPSRMNEVLSFIGSGLEDISVSRSVERARGWGIPVPGDPSQVMYVWIDALTNYINALGWSRDAPEFEHFWTSGDRRVHVLGKGVLRFHAVYWPAMLMSAGLPLPTEVVVHGYITTAGQKLSKSLNNSIDPIDLVDRYGREAVRFYLLSEFSPFRDGDFSEERLVATYNDALANGLGNLASRLSGMIGRYFEGRVPASAVTTETSAMGAQVLASSEGSSGALDRYDHREAIASIWQLVRAANTHVSETAPWVLAKAAAGGDEHAAEQLATTLYELAGAVRQLGRMLLPILPSPATTILEMFGETDGSVPDAEHWLDGLAGQEVRVAGALFPRLELTA